MDSTVKKLTAAQIERLYAFTRQHFVEHYDLQTELVDHMANAIEARWEEQPSLDFEKALQMEFKKFGVFGFMDVVEKRQRALSKKYNKLVWKYFLEFFRLPKIVFTLLLAAVYFAILDAVPFKHLFIVTSVGVLMAVSLWLAVRLKLAGRKRSREQGKKWLFEEIIFNAGVFSFLIFPQISNYIYMASGYAFENGYVRAGFSVFFVLAAVIQYVMLFKIPQQAEKHLKDTYPEYTLEVSR